MFITLLENEGYGVTRMVDPPQTSKYKMCTDPDPYKLGFYKIVHSHTHIFVCITLQYFHTVYINSSDAFLIQFLSNFSIKVFCNNPF